MSDGTQEKTPSNLADVIQLPAMGTDEYHQLRFRIYRNHHRATWSETEEGVFEVCWESYNRGWLDVKWDTDGEPMFKLTEAGRLYGNPVQNLPE